MEFGIRINSKMYFKFIINTSNAHVDAIAEVITDEGVMHEATGYVLWGDGPEDDPGDGPAGE